MKKIELGTQYRMLDISSGTINEDDRTVDLSFSSEEPVERWFGTEILDHKDTSVDLTRLNNNAAVLVDHGGDQVGVVVGARMENGIGLAKVKFSRGVRGEEIYQDIKDGIRTNVSFGYQLNDLTLEREEEGETPIYRSFAWTPHEISIVGVPADHTIGIGRSKEDVTTLEVDDNFRTLPTIENKKEEIEELIKLDRSKDIEELNDSDTQDEDNGDNSLAFARLRLAKAASKGIK